MSACLHVEFQPRKTSCPPGPGVHPKILGSGIPFSERDVPVPEIWKTENTGDCFAAFGRNFITP